MSLLPVVQVLLSTFNGDTHLRVQLDSLLSQKGVKLWVLVRDDGSTDKTISLVKSYQERFERLELIEGTQLGAARSFFELARQADPLANFYAFCDQDDLWREDKLLVATHWLRGQSLAALYCSRQTLVDENGQVLGESPIFKSQSFAQALSGNLCTGCTAVFNGSALQLLNRSTPAITPMHDWWLYLICSAFGRVYFDPQSHIDYRQHAHNHVGHLTNPVRRMAHRLRLQNRSQKVRLSQQAQSFWDNFQSSLTAENKAILQDFLSGKNSSTQRWRLVLDPRFVRRNFLETLFLKIWIGLNLY